eukprot:10903724-Lingulodinium_polyedra.AAC.1
MRVLDSAGDEELGNAVRVAAVLRLAHFLSNLRHESFVQLATEFGAVPRIALFRPAVLVLEIHVVDDVVQREFGAE